MGELIFAPIELLEERYSAQWFEWFMRDFALKGITPTVVGDTTLRQINVGQFLDVYETHIYKSKQLQEIILFIKEGWEGTIFFMDLWFPGIEALAYIRDCAKRKIRISGMLHAGTWDPWDFLSQNECGAWGRYVEYGWLRLVDQIFVASRFHKELIRSYMVDMGDWSLIESKFEIVDWPCYQSRALRNKYQKENIVVFPHRLAPEKAPEIFEQLQKVYIDRTQNFNTQFLRTKDMCSTKAGYYELLARSKVAFSSALQETFGIAMVEAWNLGAIPVCPDRLSYPETMEAWPRYRSLDEAADLVVTGIENYVLPPTSAYDMSVSHIIEKIGGLFNGEGVYSSST